MFNLMRRAAADYDQVLICFSAKPGYPRARAARYLRRSGDRQAHRQPFTAQHRPPRRRRGVRLRGLSRSFAQTVRKWRPAMAQLEFTQMAQYASDCAPAPTILVEHDITLDLYQQLLSLDDDWELRRQLDRWRRFETQAWSAMSCVVTMSDKDRRVVSGANAVALANGVDLERFPARPRRA